MENLPATVAITTTDDPICRVAGEQQCSPATRLISNLLDAGADLDTVKEMAGHSVPSTKAQFDGRGEDENQSSRAIAGPRSAARFEIV